LFGNNWYDWWTWCIPHQKKEMPSYTPVTNYHLKSEYSEACPIRSLHNKAIYICVQVTCCLFNKVSGPKATRKDRFHCTDYKINSLYMDPNMLNRIQFAQKPSQKISMLSVTVFYNKYCVHTESLHEFYYIENLQISMQQFL